MIYQATIPHIHCSGCVNSIKLYLEEKFQNVKGDEQGKTMTFESSKDIETVKKEVGELLSQLNKDMESDHGYELSELVEVKN